MREDRRRAPDSSNEALSQAAMPFDGDGADLYIRFRDTDDRRAFRLLYDHWQPALLGYIRQFLRGNYHDADCVSQETWIKIIAGAGRFVTGKKFKPWLYTIASNACRDFLRRQNRVRTHEILIGDIAPEYGLNEQDSLAGIAEYCDRKADVEALVHMRERTRVLVRNLAILPAHLQVALFLSIQGHEYESIAQTLNIPVGTVKSRLYAAKKMLRETFDIDPISL